MSKTHYNFKEIAAKILQDLNEHTGYGDEEKISVIQNRMENEIEQPNIVDIWRETWKKG